MAVASVVAKRYSRALWQLAGGKETAKKWKSSLDVLVDAMGSSKEFFELLKSPAFSTQDKWHVVQELATRAGADEGLLHFLKHTVEAGRIEALPGIVEDFNLDLLDAENTLEACIETALPLSEAQLHEVVTMLEKLVSKKVVARVVEDPSLLAGIRVQILGKTLDASLASSLEHMQRQLLSATEIVPVVAQA
jgi:F-type H+-transporting ATPase subunit delta